jgi:dihydroneopterin aldolase/2-amino-4-hydroxy-6-hydroxymethyldihydropteridine diphosphokinase/dihydropteroate synthase
MIYFSFKNFSSFQNVAYLALGSNLGNRIGNINKSCKILTELKIGKIQKTSQIYESPCLDENNSIVLEENKFLNSVIKIETSLSPMDLLLKIKEVENIFKRKPKKNYYEEREIDIDILLYNDDIIMTENENLKLQIPHPRLKDRLFVLKPILDIDPDMKIQKKDVKVMLKELLNNLNKNNKIDVEKINFYDEIDYLHKTLNFVINENQEVTFDLAKKSLLMGIVNCTPDSFSGGQLKSNTKDDYFRILEKLIENKDNLDIIDIGGESTRPGADLIDSKEEVHRLIPLIQLIRSNSSLKNKIISVDTRKAMVAKECLKLGANIINDVSGGMYDENMSDVISNFNCKYVLMHSRANPNIMMNSEFLKYSSDIENTVKVISKELIDRLNSFKNLNFQKRNILDWDILLDPGLGFSKTLEQNFNIIKNLDFLKKRFPNTLLLGHSRKKFIQKTLSKEAHQTFVGDIVISAIGISKGANILRVHDYDLQKDTLTMSDTIFKN